MWRECLAVSLARRFLIPGATFHDSPRHAARPQLLAKTTLACVCDLATLQKNSNNRFSNYLDRRPFLYRGGIAVSKASKRLRREAASAKQSRATELSNLRRRSHVARAMGDGPGRRSSGGQHHDDESRRRTHRDPRDRYPQGAGRPRRKSRKKPTRCVDSITASDIGAFPDKSVAEALQRMTGVTVTRFAAVGRHDALLGRALRRRHPRSAAGAQRIQRPRQLQREQLARPVVRRRLARAHGRRRHVQERHRRHDRRRHRRHGQSAHPRAVRLRRLRGCVLGRNGLRRPRRRSQALRLAAASATAGTPASANSASWPMPPIRKSSPSRRACSSLRFYNVQGVAAYGGGTEVDSRAVSTSATTSTTRTRKGASLAAPVAQPRRVAARDPAVQPFRISEQLGRVFPDRRHRQFADRRRISCSPVAARLRARGRAGLRVRQPRRVQRGVINEDSATAGPVPTNNPLLAHPNGYATTAATASSMPELVSATRGRPHRWLPERRAASCLGADTRSSTQTEHHRRLCR